MPSPKKKSKKRSRNSSKTYAKRKTRTRKKGSEDRSVGEDTTGVSKTKKTRKKVKKTRKKVSKRSKKKGRGFKHFEVEWDESSGGRAFVVKANNRRFFGEVRRESESCTVDILTTVKDEPVKVESIEYTDTDKLSKSSIVNDINAAIEKYLHDEPYESDVCHVCGSPEHRSINAGNLCVQYLKRRLERPTMVIRRIDTLDSLIQRLKDFRETCVRSGGSRGFSIMGDTEDSPQVWLEVDFTAQAKMLEGKTIPSGQAERLDQQAIAMIRQNKGSKTKPRDVTPESPRKKRTKTKESVAPLTSQGNIETLLEILENTEDKVERRKLRAKLRKLGHRGGLRSRKE